MAEKKLTIIGRAEMIRLLDYDVSTVAKIDTGADLSSIWATKVTERDGQLCLVLFGPKHPGYTGEMVTIPAGSFSKTRIANSFGHKEVRYVIKLRVQIKGRKVKATFSLADRKDKLYPVLLGRKLMKGKFVVDVSRGDPLHREEKQRKQKLQLELDETNDRLGV